MRVLCALVLLTSSAFAQQFTAEKLKQQPLTNESIVTLAKAGFDELFLMQLIRSSRTNFDTSVQGLVALKQAGVSEDLVRMFVMPQLIPPPPPPAATPPAKAPAKRHFSLFKKSNG